MNNQEIAREAQALLEKIAGGDAASKAAAGAPADDEPNLVSKAAQGGATQQRAAYVDPLRKSFEELASLHKGYALLGSTKVLDDPFAYLTQKNAVSGQPVVNDAQLGGMITMLLQKGEHREGVTLEQWGGRQIGAIEKGFESAMSHGVFENEAQSAVSKALDSTSGSGGPMIRVDLDPLIRIAYLRKFPAVEALNAVPANGLVHTFNIETSPGTASTVAELGDLSSTDSDVAVSRGTANIAVIATRRALSLKLQLASAQSGMNYGLTGPSNRNVVGGITAIANKNQSLVLQGNASVSGGTLSTEDGFYDVNAFNGLRQILKGGSTSITKDNAATFINTINHAIAQIANAGGNVEDLFILRSFGAAIAIDSELQSFYRIDRETPGGGFDSALSRAGIITVANALSKFIPVPAGAQSQGLGYYTISSVDYEDIDVIDPNGVEMAYLGSPSPSILELPMGFNNQLSSVYIPFLMNGLAVFIPGFHRKIRIPKQTV